MSHRCNAWRMVSMEADAPCGDTPAVMVTPGTAITDPRTTTDDATSAIPAGLVVGPVLRYVGPGEATIWVETSRAGCVEVRAGDAVASEMTFAVAGHTYALVALHGLPRRDRDAVRGPARR